jgi:hypothetical protein
MSGAAEFSLPDQLKKISAATRPTVKAAIDTVRAAGPKADEIAYRSHAPKSPRAMWKIARYAVAGENVVGIGTFPSHVTMFFYRGRELDEGAGTLKGSGKDTRFITLRAPADAQSPAVKRLVRKAFKLEAGLPKS